MKNINIQSLRKVLNIYKELLDNEKIKKGGPAYKRMKTIARIIALKEKSESVHISSKLQRYFKGQLNDITQER
mgnify:CR=1 FL=1